MLTRIRLWINEHFGPRQEVIIAADPMLVVPMRNTGPCFNGLQLERLVHDIMRITPREEEHYEWCEDCRRRVKIGHGRIWRQREILRDVRLRGRRSRSRLR